MIGKMKNLLLLAIIAALLALTNCSKDDENDRYELLTRVTWSTDSLLMNGQDASGPGEIMEKFKGTAKFNKDGTGTFGSYTGTWRFPDKTRTQLVLVTDSLPLPLTTSIVELTDISLKVTFMLPGFTDRYRMTFKAK
jgi:hypothetical protein